MDTIKVILADDHEIVRNGIKALLENEQGIEVVAEASDGQEALEKIKQYKPDVAILDIRMPVLNGIDTTLRVPNYSKATKVLVLSMHDDEDYITKSIENGAYGYLLKDSSKFEFVKAIRSVYEGHKYFSGAISDILINYVKGGTSSVTDTSSPMNGNGADSFQLSKREIQILGLLYNGTNNKEIADQLGKSIRTIETHRFNIMKKLDVNNISDLLVKINRTPSLKRLLE